MTLEERRKHVNSRTRERISLSSQIVDSIYELLVQRNLRQKVLAKMLGKSEVEIGKWMRGTHSFTIDTVFFSKRFSRHQFCKCTINLRYKLQHRQNVKDNV